MVRVAIIGYGIMGQLHHQACGQHPCAEVVAVCNRSAAKLAVAREKGVKGLYNDWQTMLADVRPDAAIVALPDRLHYQPVMDCLQAGCDVLVEKPMATNASEAVAMREKAQHLGRKLMANFSFRWDKDFQQLHSSIASGALGRPQYLYVRISDSIVVATRWLAWAAQSSPSEFLLPHSIDLVRWLTGQEFTRVYASKSEGVLRAHGVETHDVAVAICEMDGGARVCLETSWILPESHSTVVDFQVEVQGSEGMARLDRKETGIELYTAGKAERPITWLTTLNNGKGIGFFYDSVADFLDWVGGSKPAPASTADDGVAASSALEALLASMCSGQPVDVADAPKPQPTVKRETQL